MQFTEIDVVGTKSSLTARMNISETEVEAARAECPAVQSNEAVRAMDTERFGGPFECKIKVGCEHPGRRLSRLTVPNQPRNKVPMWNKVAFIKKLLRFIPLSNRFQP
jgi:hypothetical protein